MPISTLEELNALLATGRYCANGKNFPVESLYETVAESRWPHENLLGIYLTNPEHAWMAVWMAITRRDRLKKRQLKYVRPTLSEGDHLGRVELYNPDGVALPELLCERAYLYLFECNRFADAQAIDVSTEREKITALQRRGFSLETVERRGWARTGYVPNSSQKMTVAVDAWQLALINYGTVSPDLSLTLEKNLIEALAKRITFCSDEIGPNYIV